jgi:hypothetical protein
MVELERIWRNRETGKISTDEAMPAGPNWDLVGEDGNPVDTLGVGWRAGGARPAPPAPLRPYHPLRYGLEPDIEGPRVRR